MTDYGLELAGAQRRLDRLADRRFTAATRALDPERAAAEDRAEFQRGMQLLGQTVNRMAEFLGRAFLEIAESITASFRPVAELLVAQERRRERAAEARAEVAHRLTILGIDAKRVPTTGVHFNGYELVRWPLEVRAGTIVTDFRPWPCARSTANGVLAAARTARRLTLEASERW